MPAVGDPAGKRSNGPTWTLQLLLLLLLSPVAVAGRNSRPARGGAGGPARGGAGGSVALAIAILYIYVYIYIYIYIRKRGVGLYLNYAHMLQVKLQQIGGGMCRMCKKHHTFLTPLLFCRLAFPLHLFQPVTKPIK